MPPYALLCDDPRCTDPRATGGKGSSLAVLNGVEGVRVPDFFCVTTSAFRAVLEDAGTAPRIEALQAAASESPRALFAQAAALREHIETAPVREVIAEAIRSSYAELCARSGIENMAVAVRSSATTEDLEEGSFAGQHSSFLNQVGAEDVIDAVRRCWASVFNDRAVEYRNRIGVSHRDALVSVVVQKMVHARVAGTAFSIEIGTSYPGLHIAASLGLGESLVSGEVTSDEWLLDAERLHVIKQIRGSKRFRYERAADGSGIEMIATHAEEASTLCLDHAMVKAIAERTRAIAAFYRERFGYEHIDTELAISHTPTLYFVQARPVVPVMWEEIQTVDTAQAKTSDVLVRGKYALLGAVHGRLKVIEDFNDLVEGRRAIEADDIVVAVKTSNYWNQYLTHLKGIVTLEGSPTAHPILIGRERGLPCVIGCDDVVARLRPHDGQWATLDGLHKCIYLGRQPLTLATEEELTRKFEVVEVEELVSDGESLAFLVSFQRAFQDDEGTWWVANPNHPVAPMLQTMILDSFARREALVNAARDRPIGEVFYPETRVREAVVHDRLQPLADTLQAFEGMTLDEAWRFYAQFRAAGHAHVAACEAFAQAPSDAAFEAYRAAFTDLAAYFWLSWFFRTWLNGVVSRHAHALGVSQFHFERMGDVIQSGLEQEDEHLSMAILELARGLKAHGLTEDVAVDALPGALRGQLEALTRRFKIAKSTDIRLALPLEEALRLAMDEMEGLTPASEVAGQHEETFFPEHPEFQRWVELAIRARVLHCDTHHYRLRGQWHVRDTLVHLAGSEAILNAPMEAVIALL